MDDKKDDPILLTPAEVAKRLGVSPITVRSWVAKGWLASQVTPGGHRRFLWQDVERLMAEKRQPVRPQTPSETPARTARILVVDDDPQFQSFMADAIATLLPEAIVRVAANGFQAGMAMAELRPHLVLLDYAMPGLNGAAVCALIRSNAAYADTQIVAITGFADQATRNALLLAGADRILLKPLPLDTLKEVLSKFEQPVSA